MAEIVAQDLGRRLFAACDKGDVQTVVHLLEHGKPGPFINEKYDDDESPLFRAAKKGHSEIVRILIQHEADVDSVNGSEGSTPLIVATEKGEAEIFKLLVENNANINFQKLSGSERGWSALMCAVKKSYMGIVKLLLEHGAVVDLKGEMDCGATLQRIDESFLKYGVLKGTALMIACHSTEFQRVEIVQLLIEHGADVNKQNDAGITPLMFAVLNMDDFGFQISIDFESIYLPTVYSLLRYGAFVGLRTINNGLSALMIASKIGNSIAVKLLLKHGAYVNGQSSNGESALMFANENGHEKISKVLKDHGGKIYSQPDKKTKKWLDLVFACENGCTGEVIQLLNQGVDVNMINKDDGWSLLMIVSGNGNMELAKLLLEHGADVNIKNRRGLSALMFASKNGRPETIKILCEYGANINELCDSETALINAAHCGHTEAIGYLLEKGANIDMQNSNGTSALMVAVKNGLIETTNLLLKQGADIKLKDCDGNLVLFHAVDDGNPKIIQTLLDNGADMNHMQDSKLWSPLMWASHKGYSYVTKLLIEYKAQVNLQGKNGWSALMLASENNYIGIVQQLLENGADTNIQNNNGLSALMIASNWYNNRKSELSASDKVKRIDTNREIVELLLKHGANVNMQNNEGMSALMLAVKESTHLIELLLEHGAYTDLRTVTDGLSALMIASKNGNTVAVKCLLKRETNVNAQSSSGWSALMFANKMGHEKTAQVLRNHGGVSYNIIMQPDDEAKKWLDLIIACENRLIRKINNLLKQGVSVNNIPSSELSALMIVSRNGYAEIAKLLLEHGANVDLKSKKGWSALMFASQYGRAETAKLLLDYGANVNMQSNNGASAVIVAAQKGITNVVKLLLEHGADVNAQDNEGTSALLVALKNKNDETARLLLEYGADVNKQNKNMWSALMFACQRGHAKMTKLLLEYGANVNLQKKNGWTALMLVLAGTYVNFEIASLLLKYEAHINIQGSDGWSALMFACQRGHAKMTKLLLEYGANVNLQKKNGWTALMFMLAGTNAGNFEIASLLLKYGAHINIQGTDGWSALMLACQNGFTKIAHLLVEWGADVNMQSKSSGMTALMIASRDGAIKTVKLLLEHGANVNLKDNNGFSASKFASKSRFTEIVQLLAECEAIAAKFSPTVLLIEDLSAETTIEVTRSEQHFSWHEYGLRLHIPENSLPEGVQQCVIHIKASITGDYQLPQDVHLVSAVYSFKCVPKFQFSKPVTLEIQHCAKQESLQDHRLCFVRSPSGADSNFQIFPASLDSQSVNIYFPNHSSYGFVELDSFCRFALAQKRSGKRDYRANIYRHEDDARHHKIHFTIFWNTNAHNKLVSDYYKKENAVLDNHQMIVFEEKQIKLDIPFPSSVGIATENEWRILTLSPPVITKKEVDTFKKGKRIPSCLLLAKYEGETLSDLAHPVNLTGAGDPYNVFMICISGLVKRIELPGTEAEEPHTMHHQPTSSNTGQDRTKFDKLLPSLDDLILKYTDKGEIKKVRIINDASHKWKDIASIICGDTNKTTVLQQKCPGDPNECLRQIFIENFISKKPQKYSQDWNGLIELLDDVDLEILAKEVRHALSCI